MKKILVIEDNEKNMYLITFILEKMGHRVVQAGTGEKGLELAELEHPDLILMDIQLPGMDGLRQQSAFVSPGMSRSSLSPHTPWPEIGNASWSPGAADT